MKQADVLAKTRKYVQSELEGEGSGHDWWHIVRVVNNSKLISSAEGGEEFIIELGALLHDIADSKFHDGDKTIGPKLTRQWLSKLGVKESDVERVAYIVEHISFRGGTNKHKMQTLEGKIVQDADRLDALGAVGVARAFAFGGSFGRTMYDPSVKPFTNVETSFRKGEKSKSHTINHFYEKLLLLEGLMNTQTAKKIAKNRHVFMENFLKQFYAEWEGKR